MQVTSSTAMFYGRKSDVMAWWWDDNNDVHHFEHKANRWDSNGGAASVRLGEDDLQVAQQSEVHFAPPAVQKAVAWANGPVVTWSKFGNDSEQYWSWTTTVTVPLPKSILRVGDFIDLSMTVAIYTDVNQPYGTYSQPEGAQVRLEGFGQVYKTIWQSPKKIGGNWFTELFLAAQAAVSETFPVPHVVIQFNTENVGGVQGSVKIDWDTLVVTTLSLVGTKLTLRALR